MARITVEDTVGKVKDRFELVVLSAFRAKEIYAGNKALVERDNNKNPVIAIREIEDDKTTAEDLRNALISTFQTHIVNDEIVPDTSDDAEILDEIKRELEGFVPEVAVEAEIDADSAIEGLAVEEEVGFEEDAKNEG